MIIGAVILSWLMGSPIRMKPLWVSKFNTAAQILFACLVLASLGFGFTIEPLRVGLMLAVAALTLLSIAAYLAEWVRHMNSTTPAGQ